MGVGHAVSRERGIASGRARRGANRIELSRSVRAAERARKRGARTSRQSLTWPCLPAISVAPVLRRFQAIRNKCSKIRQRQNECSKKMFSVLGYFATPAPPFQHPRPRQASGGRGNAASTSESSRGPPGAVDRRSLRDQGRPWQSSNESGRESRDCGGQIRGHQMDVLYDRLPDHHPPGRRGCARPRRSLVAFTAAPP
jgi:hypothetical protein